MCFSSPLPGLKIRKPDDAERANYLVAASWALGGDRKTLVTFESIFSVGIGATA